MDGWIGVCIYRYTIFEFVFLVERAWIRFFSGDYGFRGKFRQYSIHINNTNK